MNQNIEVKSTPPIYSVRDALLDSSLIIQTNKFLYDMKIIVCGDYVQTYKTKEKHLKTNNSYSSITLLENNKIIIIDNDCSSSYISSYKEIRLDNAMRSKMCIERLVKTNEKDLLTFITLTFKDNITDIKEANKLFNIWRSRIKKKFGNLKYICVPEYQKRGAVHYHLITNIPLNSSIITPQSGKSNQYDVLYWDNGFSSVYIIDNVSTIATYISKYITKDIDNRLFGRRRFFHSRNLKLPQIEYFDTSNPEFLTHLNLLLEKKSLSYTNVYLNKYTNEEIEFKEYAVNKEEFHNLYP